MSADIFRTSQLIIIMLNQKHSYLTFNKGGEESKMVKKINLDEIHQIELEIIKIEIINNCIDYADRVVRSYVFINSLWKKNGLVGNVRTKM